MRPARGAGAWRHARVACAGFAALVALAAALVAVFWSEVFDAILSKSMRLAPDSRAYSEWVSPSLPIYFDVYLFNWTNPERLVLGEPPHVTQLGPYRFRERREKVTIAWHPHNASVSYRTRRTWTFDAAASAGSLHDQVTTLDVVVASAVYRARHWDALWQGALSVGFKMYSREVWTRRTASELLFEGYQDPLLDMASLLPLSLREGTPAVDRFGWFYQRNGSLDNDGHMTVSTGASGAGAAGQVLLWNHRARLPHLPGACNRLSGSLGEFFQRHLDRGAESVALFSPDLCRPLSFSRAAAAPAPRTLHDLPVLKFEADAQLFDNGTAGGNACYCAGECVPSGALNVSACRFGAPAFISLPHFLHADPHYTRAVRGLAPDAAAHSFYMQLEPTSGVPLEVAARFQLNILLSPNKHIALYARVPRLLMPVLWVEQRVLMDAGTARELGAVRAAAAWGGASAGAVCVAALCLCALALAPDLVRRTRAPPREAPAAPEPRAELTVLLAPARPT